MTSRVVVALGGNAILRKGDTGTFEQQTRRARDAMRRVAALVAEGHEVVVTHGNGPVVGNIIVRNEAGKEFIPPMPLSVADADSQGGIGFMLELALRNALTERDLHRTVATVLTQALVSGDDPAFETPTKPIGPYYSKEAAERLAAQQGWAFAPAGPGALRRVVASPRPIRLLEADAVGTLVASGAIVIAAGGGGVPVVEGAEGRLEPVDAVVDKDWSSALLACHLRADMLVIVMEADRVYLGFGTAEQRGLERLGASEARRLLDGGAFDAGSMAPKIEASLRFLGRREGETVICAAEDLSAAVAGRAGTRIVRD